MDPTLVSGTWFESQFQICVYEHAILSIYISFFFHQKLDEFLKRLEKEMKKIDTFNRRFFSA